VVSHNGPPQVWEAMRPNTHQHTCSDRNQRVAFVLLMCTFSGPQCLSTSMIDFASSDREPGAWHALHYWGPDRTVHATAYREQYGHPRTPSRYVKAYLAAAVGALVLLPRNSSPIWVMQRPDTPFRCNHADT
jgi:hypothetical protein